MRERKQIRSLAILSAAVVFAVSVFARETKFIAHGWDCQSAHPEDVLASAAEFETYAVARVIANPEISFETVEREYLSQFGVAADVMREYFARIRARCEKALRETRAAEPSAREMVQDDSALHCRVLRTPGARSRVRVLHPEMELAD